MASEDDLKKLLVDRVEFKLHAAEHHLINLKEIEIKYVDTSKKALRVQSEMETDCFLAQIVGAIDALLVQININLGLGIAIEKVDLSTVQSALNSGTKNIDLLTELYQASSYDNWFWLLKELRNQSMHRTMLQRTQDYDSSTDKTKISISKQRTKFTVNPSDFIHKELIQYFQESIQRVRDLVKTIRMKDALLKGDIEKLEG